MLQPPEAGKGRLLKRVSSRVFGTAESNALSASTSRSSSSDAQLERERTFLPRQLSGWFASVLSTAEPAAVERPASQTPQRAQRSLGGLDRMLERAVQFLTDSDASTDKCADDIWLIGGVLHEGWRPPAEQQKPSRGQALKKARRSSALDSPDRSPAKSRLKSALRKKRSRAAFRQSTNELEGTEARIETKPKLLFAQPLTPAAPPDRMEHPPPSPSALSSIDSSETDFSVVAPTLSQSNGWPPLFYLDFASRIQLTYRSGFAPIPCTPPGSISRSLSAAMNTLTASLGRTSTSPVNEGLVSDAGWGCMLRTGQSLLANALSFIHLGREWRRILPHSPETPASLPPHYGTYVRLLSWFLDDATGTCPFSVHRFALEGQKLGKAVGEWFGPSTAAGAIKSLTNAFAPANLSVVTSIDGSLYRNEVHAAAAAHDAVSWTKPVLILLNLRLGIEGVNPIYHDSIKDLFRLPQLVGIAGGRPSSSYYFVGNQGDALFYLDPHHTKPAISLQSLPSSLVSAAMTMPMRGASDDWERLEMPTAATSLADRLDAWYSAAYPEHDLRSYHCDRVRKMPLTGLDPSMLVGLLCQSQSDFDDLCERLRQVKTPLVAVAERTPAWARSASDARKVSAPSVSTASESAVEVEEDDQAASFDEPDDAWEISDADESSIDEAIGKSDRTTAGDAETSRA